MKPLFFKPRLIEKIWGGGRLYSLLKKGLSGSMSIGESWEISGYPGSETRCLTPPFENIFLNDIFRENTSEIAGSAVSNQKEILFPLLFKYIDASDNLSVQVHPPDKTDGGYIVNGKTECWYIVDALPGSSLISGFKKGVTKPDVEHYINKGALEDLLNRVSVKAGDVVFIPAGCVHAISEGILLYEIQQTSDATYRLYDWNRKDKNGKFRELHIMDSLEVMDTGWHDRYKISRLAADDFEPGHHSLRAACRYFAVEEFLFKKQGRYRLPARDSFNVITCLEREACIEGDFDGGCAVLKTGDTVLIPRSLGRAVISGESSTRLLNTWIPDLKKDVVDLCRAQGHRDKDIISLGGALKRRDIDDYI